MAVNEQLVTKQLTKAIDNHLKGKDWVKASNKILHNDYVTASGDYVCNTCGHPYRLHLEVSEGFKLTCTGELIQTI